VEAENEEDSFINGGRASLSYLEWWGHHAVLFARKTG